MNNKRQYDLQIGVILLIATIVVAFFTMTALGGFKLGLHFDKDMRVIAEVNNHQSMYDFISHKQTQGYESDLVISQNNIAILNISGIENTDGFIKEMLASVPTARVILMGSFGSMTKFLNNQSFIAISFLITCIVITLYQVSMYRMYGWYKALEIILLMMAPLFILNQNGYAFGISAWYGLLSLLLMQLIVAEHYHNQIKLRILLGVGLSVLGLMVYAAQLDRFYPMAVLFVSTGMISVVLSLVYHFIMEPFISAHELFVPQEEKRLLVVSNDGSYTKIKLLTVVILAVAMISVLSMARGQYQTDGGERGHYKELVINPSDSTNYLEIQALLSAQGLFDQQVSYLVSEQGQTWIEFTSDTSLLDLNDAQVALLESFNLHSVFFDGVAPIDHFNTQTFNILLGCVMTLLTLYIGSSESLFSALSYVVELLASMGFYTFIVYKMDLNLNQAWLIGLLVIPFLYYLINNNFKKEESVTYFIDSLIVTSLFLMMFALPIFVIVPSAVSAELIFYFVFLLIAIYIGLAVGALIHKLKGSGVYESFKS